MNDDGVTRRDFLNGVSVALGASLLAPWADLIAQGWDPGSDYYPPARTGLRGTHEGAWETMHARVQGKTWRAGAPEEQYDLVIVGGGISGLASAHLYRKQRPNARILILDNHDDFGGHAKRNEFSIDGQTRIGYGGTESIDTPSAYTAIAKETLVDIGIDTAKFYEAYDQTLYAKLGLSKSILFDQENFGERKLVLGYGKVSWEEFARNAPLNDQARADFIRVQTETRDYLPGLTREEKYAKLRTVSYETWLRDYCKVDPQLLELYRKFGISFWCVGIDEIPCTSIHEYDGGMPGLDHTLPRYGSRGNEPYIFHFPDGNASVARLLVRKLIPAAMPGSTMEDVVTARADYSQLDRKGSAVRLRLNSTAVHVRHTASRNAVDVTYVHDARAHTVRARRVIMACYNMAIPHLCPELPAAQQHGLRYGVKVPLTYTKVLIPNWRAFAQLGTDFVYYTKDFFKQVELDYPVSLGSYKRSQTPDEPMVLHMCYVHHDGKSKGPEQWRDGRRRLMETSFAQFEGHVRDQLDAALKGGGFDAGRDIKAITVNRWPHGYAYSPELLWEPAYASEAEKPWVIGRQRYGRIAIANSDAGAKADTNSAITQAWRAVQESLA
ncbi:MAG TPA: NAD(P)-binding protein [Gemmatimonadaceae bacterium]|nr:NAD(P)-binding protein [Gemmatimonadota bacterium]MBK8649375.1 NAD(P)-binding protein [Gemmatimonadota bacterium]MBK9408615.1 NAD(P)-binding protein [Gemmatimonadota bacterium]HNV74002.1 NAD(P)-binding protein [Gemmatimonadaceae bacterium]